MPPSRLFPPLECWLGTVNWFRKGADGKFIWPGYGENMRVLQWILERGAGRAEGVDHVFGISPRYEDLNWKGLDFSPAQFQQATSIDPEAWRAELELHGELFRQLAYIESRLAA